MSTAFIVGLIATTAPRSNFLPSLSIAFIVNMSSNTTLDDAEVMLLVLFRTDVEAEQKVYIVRRTQIQQRMIWSHVHAIFFFGDVRCVIIRIMSVNYI